MLKAGDKRWYKLSTRLAQVLNLDTVSTGFVVLGKLLSFLYGLVHTASAQLASGFAQPKTSDFNLLGLNLYTVSTAPITNTKLI
jgi:hypothetical protein